MNIVMMTNTYKPILGGLEKSVETFTNEFRKLGHRVIIVAPEYEGMVPEEDLIRIPAIQNFNGSDFSVQLPIPLALTDALVDFKPDIIHTHHPFLIGDTALRMASKYNVPLVFTHHTLYEENVHYLPGNEQALKEFVIELSTGYANLADQVFAPSESVEKMIRHRGVETAISVVPTGIYVDDYNRGAGKGFRRHFKIPSDAFVVGYLGRLVPEKNLEFVALSVAEFLKKNSNTYFLVVGSGPLDQKIQEIFENENVLDRLCLAGSKQGKEKVDALHAMDVFAYASQSETQGIVLIEALAAKVPIVAVDAPGIREVVHDKVTGRLLEKEDLSTFVEALEWMKQLSIADMSAIKIASRKCAEGFAMDISVKKALEIYASLSVRQGFSRRPSNESAWEKTRRLIQAQTGLFKNFTRATGALVSSVLSPSKEHPDSQSKKDEPMARAFSFNHKFI